MTLQSPPQTAIVGFRLDPFQERGSDQGFVLTEEVVALLPAANERHTFDAFFCPRSIAVIGASRQPDAIGHKVLKALLDAGFSGPVYPVNRNVSELLGKTAYRQTRDLPEGTDLAIIVVPATSVAATIHDCASIGIRAVVVISAGYSEVGEVGREAQLSLLNTVRGYGMRMIGPNCFGIINASAAVRMNASFSPVFPPAGRVSMASQSGALGLMILGLAKQFDLGISKFVSLGNKADVSSNDLIEYWEADSDTDVILLYLESFGNPTKFSRLARRIARKKPIIAVKSGRTRAGAKAAGSHTAALAASDDAVDALFRQSGVIRVDTLEEMFDLAAALSHQALPAGRRVGIVSNAGGPAILCSDTCESLGLEVVEFAASTQASLRQSLPPAAAVSNPVDMVASASASHFKSVIETVLCAPEVDALIVMYTVLDEDVNKIVLGGISEGVAGARSKMASRKPVLFCLMSPQGVHVSLPCAHGETVPGYRFPEQPARALAHMLRHATWKAKPEPQFPMFPEARYDEARSLCQGALAKRGKSWLTASECRRILDCALLPALSGGIAQTIDEAVEIAKNLASPVALKLVSQEITHKTEVGGVILGLSTADAVREGFKSIVASLERIGRSGDMEGVLVQPMVTGATEILVGMTRDRLFGPLIAMGLGGIHVEILRDICFRLAPISTDDAEEMIRGIKGYPLLEGYRGHPAADIPAIADLLLKVSRLSEAVPEIAAIDLNPVMALERGCAVVDVRIQISAT